jgi:hypothetical protein
MNNYNQSGYGYNQPGYGYNQSEETVVGGYRENATIVVDNNAKYILDSITKWVKFLSILGIIAYALLIIVGFGIMAFGGVAAANFGLGDFEGIIGVFAGVFYIIIGAICLYPVIKMLNYSTKMKTAIRSDRQDIYEEALRNFNSAVKFWGILAVIALVIYSLVFIFAMIGAMVS